MFWFSLLLALNHAPRQQVELSASNVRPYPGQIVELSLRFRLPPQAEPYPLSLDWEQDSAWRWAIPLEQLICSHAAGTPSGLPLTWRGHRFFAPQVEPGLHELRWPILITDQASIDEPIGLNAVRIGTQRSSSLSLEVRALPSPPSPARVWNLGVGAYSIRASWDRSTLSLGEETSLEFAVSGNGHLSGIPPPTLAGQSGWESDAFLFDPSPETWRGRASARVFRFSVRPRRLGVQSPPALLACYFDPQREAWQMVQVQPPDLTVGSAPEYVPSPAETDRIRGLISEWLARERIPRPMVFTMALALPLGFAILVIIRWQAMRRFPDWFIRRRWRLAAQRANRQAARTEDISQLRQVLAGFLGMGLDRPVDPDIDSLSAALARAGLQDSFHPLLGGMQEAEFGPEQPGSQDQLIRLAGAAFASLEARQ
jgi:hypothetical protein